MATRRIAPQDGRTAVTSWLAGNAPRGDVATAVRFTLEELAAAVPGRAVEVRVPPFGATQAVAGPRHTRGTPPNVVQTDPDTWLSLATGRLTWDDAVASSRIQASGSRSDLSAYLPLFQPGASPVGEGLD
ncbi:MAG: sterol carrier family protein [Bifidobacteriaceae bacterium]|jgi:hypothetical protein|nr:sterol carrier family protein [Bifidobacteriaceae bacterium]